MKCGFSLGTLLCSLAATHRHTDKKGDTYHCGTLFSLQTDFYTKVFFLIAFVELGWNKPSIYLSGTWTRLMNHPHCHSSVISKHMLSHISPSAKALQALQRRGPSFQQLYPACVCVCWANRSTCLAWPLKTTMLYCPMPGLK